MYGTILGLLAGSYVAYKLVNSDTKTPVKKPTPNPGPNMPLWFMISPDQPPGNVFYPSGTTPLVDKTWLPIGTIVTVVMSGPPNVKSGGFPPLMEGQFRVAARDDAQGSLYGLVLVSIVNVTDTVVPEQLPPLGFTIIGAPPILLGNVL